MEQEINRGHLDQHVHPKLRNRVRLYLGIAVVIALVIAYRMIRYGAGLYPFLALAIGLILGVLLSRMYIVSWDKNAEKVVSRMDIYGTILLVGYVIFEISGDHYIREWFSGPEVLTIILSLAGGAILGRGLGMARKMVQVLRENIY